MNGTDDEDASSSAGDPARTCLAAPLGQHVHVTRRPADDGRPAMTTLTDPGSGDGLTSAVIDLLEVSDPHALLTYSFDALLSAYGPFDGERRARDYLTALPTAERTAAFSRTVALHHPDEPFLPADEWLPVPAELAQRVRPDGSDGATTVLVLLDRRRRLFAAIGPFTECADASTWWPATPLPDGVHRLPVGLQPTVTGWRNA